MSKKQWQTAIQSKTPARTAKVDALIGLYENKAEAGQAFDAFVAALPEATRKGAFTKERDHAYVSQDVALTFAMQSDLRMKDPIMHPGAEEFARAPVPPGFFVGAQLILTEDQSRVQSALGRNKQRAGLASVLPSR